MATAHIPRCLNCSRVIPANMVGNYCSSSCATATFATQTQPLVVKKCYQCGTTTSSNTSIGSQGYCSLSCLAAALHMNTPMHLAPSTPPPTVEEDQPEPPAPVPVIKMWPVSTDCMLDFEGMSGIYVIDANETGADGPRMPAIDRKRVRFVFLDATRNVDVLYDNLLPAFKNWLIDKGLTK